ncbi:MAG: zf-HC2 domain-containing protein [Myxococcaceae bacterium]
MDCRELELQSTPYLDGELIDEARLGVENHLATCETCRRHVEIERHNLLAIRQAARSAAPTAPPEFKARLFENLRRDEATTRRASVRRAMALAAGVAVVVVAGHQGWRGYQRRLFEQDAALRHARQFPLEVQQSPEGIERWFGGKLDYRVSVPRFPNARAAGGRLLQVRDKPAAYIRYDAVPGRVTNASANGDGRVMGLFVYGDDGEVDVGSEPAMGSSHGYNVVSWREGDVVYQLVTDLDEADIRDLVPSTPGAAGAPVPGTSAPVDVRPAALQR